jgi:hypothetical protein
LPFVGPTIPEDFMKALIHAIRSGGRRNNACHMAMSLPRRRADWVLLALTARRSEPLTPAQLQETMFLVSRAVRAAAGIRLYDFSAREYGQHDLAVYRDTEALANEGLLCVDRVGRRLGYAATNWGAIRAEAVAARVPLPLRQRVSTAAAWAKKNEDNRLHT